MNKPRDKDATAGDGDVLPPSWEVKDWLSSMALLEAIADSLIKPLSKEDARLQLPYVRALVHEQQLEAALVRMLQDPKLQHRLAKLIADGVRQLGDATAASGEEFNSKFQGEPGTFQMAFANLSHFYSGLEAVVGTPNPNLDESMCREHCASVDSYTKWTTGNYGVTTSPSIEWWFVNDPTGGLEQAGVDAWPAEAKGIPEEEKAEKSRKPLPLSHFEQAISTVNKDLEDMGEPKVIVQEKIGVRLYTGPMFEKYPVAFGPSRLRAWDDLGCR